LVVHTVDVTNATDSTVFVGGVQAVGEVTACAMVSTDSTGTELINAIVIARASLFWRHSRTVVRTANLTPRRIEVKGRASITIIQNAASFVTTFSWITCGFIAWNWIATILRALTATNTAAETFLAKNRTRAEDGAVDIGRVIAIEVRRTGTEVAAFALGAVLVSGVTIRIEFTQSSL
jgi:hypothetical protein